MNNQIPTIALRPTKVLLSLLFASVSTSTNADPPNGGDAPGTFEEAWPINPGTYYGGTFELPADIDVYRFGVESVQEVAVYCAQASGVVAYHGPIGPVPVGMVSAGAGLPCVARLIDPAGNRQDLSSSPSAGCDQPSVGPQLSLRASCFYSTAFSAESPGDWRIEMEGPATLSYYPVGINIYSFHVTLSPVVASGQPGVLVNESGGSSNIAEGSAQDSYTLTLNSQPTADVTITLNPDNQLTVTPPTVTFTAANFSKPQTVTVSAADDLVAEGSHTGTISHTVSSADSGYDRMPVSSVTATITDNDVPGVSMSESGGSTQVSEGDGSDSYALTLVTRPTADVTVTLNPGNHLSVSPMSVRFTTANFDTPQEITVTAVNDDVAEGPHAGTITHAVTGADSSYNNLAARNVTANITDNDVAAVVVTQFGGSTDVSESGGEDGYSLVLTSQPLANVTVTINPGNQLVADPAEAIFTPSNFTTPQSVMISAVDDSVVEGDHMGTLTHSTSSDDSDYKGLSISSVAVSITDNDQDVSEQTQNSSDDGSSGSFSWATLAGLLSLGLRRGSPRLMRGQLRRHAPRSTGGAYAMQVAYGRARAGG